MNTEERKPMEAVAAVICDGNRIFHIKRLWRMERLVEVSIYNISLFIRLLFYFG